MPLEHFTFGSCHPVTLLWFFLCALCVLIFRISKRRGRKERRARQEKNVNRRHHPPSGHIPQSHCPQPPSFGRKVTILIRDWIRGRYLLHRRSFFERSSWLAAS